MKSFVISAILAVGLSISAFAEQVKTPTMQGDNPAMDYVGVSTCRIDSSTGTNALLCTGNPSIVYGVAASSMAANDHILLYSTNSTVLAGAEVKKRAVATTATINNELTFVKPILFPKGVVADAQVAPTAGGNSEWIIYYREAR